MARKSKKKTQSAIAGGKGKDASLESSDSVERPEPVSPSEPEKVEKQEPSPSVPAPKEKGVEGLAIHKIAGKQRKFRKGKK